MHVRVTWSPKYDEMLETAKGMREQIASLFVRGPARGLHGGSARKNAGCAQKKPKGLKSGTCCGTGARVGVETRPAHEPTSGRVTTRKRGRGGASQEVWGDGVEGADDTVRSGEWLGAMGYRYPSLHTLALACHWDIDG